MTCPNCGSSSCPGARVSSKSNSDGGWVSNSPASDPSYPSGSWIESRGTKDLHTTTIYNPDTHVVIGSKNTRGSWWSNLFNSLNK